MSTEPPIVRLAFSITEVARSLGVGRRTVERLISSGQFPKADFYIGRMPRWKPESVRQWIERGGEA